MVGGEGAVGVMVKGVLVDEEARMAVAWVGVVVDLTKFDVKEHAVCPPL